MMFDTSLILLNYKIFLVSEEIAFQLNRGREKKEHVDLTLDMFGLTFSIFGGMTVATMIVFAAEMLIGKRDKNKDKNGPKNGKKDEESTRNEVREAADQSHRTTTVDENEPIEIVEIS